MASLPVSSCQTSLHKKRSSMHDSGSPTARGGRFVHSILFWRPLIAVSVFGTSTGLGLNSFSDVSKRLSLTISLEKIEVLFQRAPNSVAPQSAVSIDDVELKVVDSFKYLGSMISHDGSLDTEIASRIGKASQALGRLRNRLLNHQNVTLDTKLKVYRDVVLSSLLYGCETWTVYRRHLKQLILIKKGVIHQGSSCSSYSNCVFVDLTSKNSQPLGVGS